MRKIIFTLLLISIALAGFSFVCASDVDAGTSDVLIIQDDQPIVPDVQPIVQDPQPIVQDSPAVLQSTKKPDLWSYLKDLSWTHHERNPRGLCDDISLRPTLYGGSGFHSTLGGSIGGGSANNFYTTFGGSLGGGGYEHYYLC
ncbi:hypothetical protein TL18_07685 [Methanobrevibacter sp. YE315]|uniref:hypothetical protein n=1 Tax=Methanobrevibacter sp. YE315 TaxID=1609968 RepID=UPI000764E67F|nr:hypothetical protein [Methanobrevibacter sp. YE315]AMD17916.1 hypothetical protein TL18_07685 [Methanobrevibacter sp. YE315]